jgi:hypothetical protein
MSIVLQVTVDETFAIIYFTFLSHLLEHTLSQYAMGVNLSQMYSCHIENAFLVFSKVLDVLQLVFEKVPIIFIQNAPYCFHIFHLHMQTESRLFL